MGQQNNYVVNLSHMVGHMRKVLCAGRTQYRVLGLVATGTLATLAISGACAWGWATQNCTTFGCQGPNCQNTDILVNTKYYCQQQGAFCCQCKETSYRCSTTGICSTSFWYVRERSESATGDCPQGQNGVACVE